MGKVKANYYGCITQVRTHHAYNDNGNAISYAQPIAKPRPAHHANTIKSTCADRKPPHTTTTTQFPKPQTQTQKQLPAKGGKGGYREQYPLADANRCAVGGWDIRGKPLGDALYESHVLDYDLVRQVKIDGFGGVVGGMRWGGRIVFRVW